MESTQATGDKATASGGYRHFAAPPSLSAKSVIFEGARRIAVRNLELAPPAETDIVVDVDWSGVSAGTERLLWTGEMPPFPGLAYPLVPGYEAVGRIIWSQSRPDLAGRKVFVPGSRCFKGAHGLFGAAASRIVTPLSRAALLPESGVDGADMTLLALAATARHALAGGDFPELVIGHGLLGRLICRIAIAMGGDPPNVWEIDPARADADGYAVIDSECDARADYRVIFDASGDAGILDKALPALGKGGEIVLAGFYSSRVGFNFPPAFMREMRLRIAAEWKPEDLDAVLALAASGALSFDGLITHAVDASDACSAYRTAFEDSDCVKMVLNWSALQ